MVKKARTGARSSVGKRSGRSRSPVRAAPDRRSASAATAVADTARQVNTADLKKVIDNCFLGSMDGRLTPEQQDLLLAQGTKLRERHRQLLRVVFDAATPQLAEANKSIASVNRQLREALQRVERIASAIEQLGRLVAVLDELVRLAAGLM